MNRMMKLLLIFCIILCSIVFPCLYLIISGSANLFVDSFAVDSYDKLYIGKAGKIDVYDNGSFQYSIDICAAENYAFTITDDNHIILATLHSVYTLTLQGDEIAVSDDPYSDMYDKLKSTNHIFQTQNGNTYKRVCYLGRSKIIKNDHDVVYRIDLMSFVVKMLTAGSVIAIFCFTSFMAVRNLIKIQKDKKRQKTQKTD